MAILKHNIRASTLIESLIAMVVVMISFGVVTALYLNVTTSGDEMRKLKTRLSIDKIVIETKQKELFINEEIMIDNIKFKKNISTYGNYKNIIHLNISAFDSNNKIIADHNELIPVQ